MHTHTNSGNNIILYYTVNVKFMLRNEFDNVIAIPTVLYYDLFRFQKICSSSASISESPLKKNMLLRYNASVPCNCLHRSVLLLVSHILMSSLKRRKIENTVVQRHKSHSHPFYRVQDVSVHRCCYMFVGSKFRISQTYNIMVITNINSSIGLSKQIYYNKISHHKNSSLFKLFCAN